MTDILVVGAGPVGLTMACELARHGARCRIIDRAPEPLPYCRAIGVTPRTLEVWDDMGIARTMIDAGLWLTGQRSVIAGQPPHDAAAPPLGLPYAQLGLPQYTTERVLTQHLAGFGLTVERGVELASLRQDGAAATVSLARADGSIEEARFRYVVGCDGAHSAVRKALGIAFEGDAFPWPFMLGDVHIDWGLPYGMALRALRLNEGAPPDMFIAIPLPEAGRYRVSMMAPPALASAGGTDHGIQAELEGPDLAALQVVADALLPERPRLSDLRWSSIFRISMRLAAHYRQGRVFIAGDAAHIHPPTGGQGMNTGIQDAYNLAWKLALAATDAAPEALLDSYEAERLPVGAEVVARTEAASVSYGREQGGGAPDSRLVDAQVLVSYRGTPFVQDDAAGAVGPNAGDRAPDVTGLTRDGLGFPLRLFDILRGTGHVLLVQLAADDADAAVAELAAFTATLRARSVPAVRVVAIGPLGPAQRPGLVVLHDPDGAFLAFYGEAGAFLVRPDGHIGWRGRSWRDAGLGAYLDKVLRAPDRSAP
ncbi:FAD-dependent monooxygenase [Chelatococcus reniformis]|uniref:3-(3-hydroxyphenyl)propionate hydroxylase n=1 Tax=Chelatococcus reniformis TaxID=1494448 RepID=A0A916U6F8_9HYPH|nr:FAD-dependent monooxygenase [Chelatococcus reniformis]GGC59423.1 3-(3-hydroxyphenyl)propionate hydroxylase [Chelatococcus reniformis]